VSGYRIRIPAKEHPRVSAREAAVTVAEALGRDVLARRLRRGGGDPQGGALPCNLSPATLTDAEATAFARALGAVGTRVEALRIAMRADQPKPRKKAGRQGAPARDWLRSEVTALLAAIDSRNPECDRLRVAALLLMLHGLDSDTVFWRTDEKPPPVGRARIAWLSKRLSDLGGARKTR
jgi:hypothetical protein